MQCIKRPEYSDAVVQISIPPHGVEIFEERRLHQFVHVTLIISATTIIFIVPPLEGGGLLTEAPK